MAQLFTLSPSPPPLGDPSAAPSVAPSVLPASSCPESVKERPVPKSSLYTDKALTASTSSALLGGSSLTAHLPKSSTKLTADPALPSLTPEAAPETEEPVGNQQETSDQNVVDLSNTETGSSEVAAQTKVPDESLSPDLNPGPNLYPNVHVPSNANPVVDIARPQTSSDFNPTPVPPEATSSTDEEKPRPPEQAQKPQNYPPPQSPKPDPINEAMKEDLPTTPTSAAPPSPTVPVIHEPAAPLTNRKPAPDTLSYLDSASLMSGTLESLSGLGEDGSSLGSDSEINGLTIRRTDKYGFLGGTQYSEGGEKDVQVEVARQREMKWLDMFCHWDKWVKHRFQKVKLRCRKGIPSSLRSKAWQLLSDSQELLEANPGKFEELEREPGEPKWLDIIEKDLHRQFPFHEMFAARGGHGQQDLYRILKAYTVYRPDEGYCQAQAPVAAVLLMHMPAEQAFWCLVQICDKYLPGYYSAGL
ncbi:hypothetical protein XENOCAPTIV_028199, partial [Xenoophorus captivus]